MSDLSPAVPWLAAGICCLLSVLIGRHHGSADGSGSVLVAGLKAAGLALASIFVASYIHTLCIESFHLCRSRGDGNISYALPPVLGAPLYWLLIQLFSRHKAQAPGAEVDPHAAASARAVLQHSQGGPSATRCPACGDLIAVVTEPPTGHATHLLTQCRCKRSNARYALQPPARKPAPRP